MPHSSATLSSHVHEQIIQPFRLSVPQSALDGLKSRLASTRWPDELPGTGADYGAELSFVRETAEYLAHDIRLARAGSQDQCCSPIHYDDRRTGHPFLPRALAGA